jgi:hypothetical protein
MGFNVIDFLDFIGFATANLTRQQLEAGFDERVIPFTRETAHVWAQMCADAEAVGVHGSVLTFQHLQQTQ